VRVTQTLWRDRQHAGQELANQLRSWRSLPEAVVVGLPRGGIVVAAELASALRLPLVSWAVRKLTHPTAPELALGAIAPGGVLIWDEPYLHQWHLNPQLRRQLVLESDKELQRRQRLYGDPPLAALRGRPLLVVDDGVATGMTVMAALQSLRQAKPKRLVLAVPVIARSVAARLRAQVDQLVALEEADDLWAVGAWYEHFEPVEDGEVQALIACHSWDPASKQAAIPQRGTEDHA
jgi:putative phosphoribosyl transferase